MPERWGSYWCDECGHGWNWHATYDQTAGRYLNHGCDHFNQCKCEGFVAGTLKPLPQ